MKAYGAGAWPYDLVAGPWGAGPIGGSEGYSQILDPTGATEVGDAASLKAALLSTAIRIYVANDIVLAPADIPASPKGLVVKPGVTLFGDRGYAGSPGPCISISGLEHTATYPILFNLSAGGRITGLWLEGPLRIWPIATVINTGRWTGIWGLGNLAVDNCEVAGFPDIGIYAPTSFNVHHNYVHHIGYSSSGYGIIGSQVGANGQIVANIIDYCRMHMVISGKGASDYIAYNDCGPNGSTLVVRGGADAQYTAAAGLLTFSGYTVTGPASGNLAQFVAGQEIWFATNSGTLATDTANPTTNKGPFHVVSSSATQLVLAEAVSSETQIAYPISIYSPDVPASVDMVVEFNTMRHSTSGYTICSIKGIPQVEALFNRNWFLRTAGLETEIIFQDLSRIGGSRPHPWLTDLAANITATDNYLSLTEPPDVGTPTTGTLAIAVSGVASAPITVNGTARTAPVTLTVAAGSYTVVFGAVSGYTTPPQQIVSVTTGATRSVIGVYAPLAGVGSLIINISGVASAPITINGTPYTAPLTLTNLPAGPYTVAFGAVSGYTAPGSQMVNVPTSGSATVSGTYMPDTATTGILVISIVGVGSAYVWIDNYPIGLVTSGTPLEYEVDAEYRYVVSFEDKDGYVIPVAITSPVVKPGVSYPMVGTYSLVPTEATITVFTNLTTTVYVDGEDAGVASPQDPLLLYLPVGQYTISFMEILGIKPADQVIDIAILAPQSVTVTYTTTPPIVPRDNKLVYAGVGVAGLLILLLASIGKKKK
jgi:hypothetical protein